MLKSISARRDILISIYDKITDILFLIVQHLTKWFRDNGFNDIEPLVPRVMDQREKRMMLI